MYKVVANFTDLQDNNHEYLVGDIFPHKGFSVSDERIAELISQNNRRGVPLIEEIEPDQPKKAEISNVSSEDDKVITKKKRVRKTAKNG